MMINETKPSLKASCLVQALALAGTGHHRFLWCSKKLKYSDVPEGLRGLGITFISV